MAFQEIVLPETEPETEWVRGRALQKMSPTRDHSLLQYAFAKAFDLWAGSRIDVGPEWRFRIAPPGEPPRPLVPDVAVVFSERLKGLSGRDLQVPLLAPDVVVEILSSDERRIDVDDKIQTYLAAGCPVVIIVDPISARVELHDADARSELTEHDVLTHASLPGFALPLRDVFDKIRPR
jgi:Uma2 family endonuclease